MLQQMPSNRQSVNRKIAVMGYPHVGKSAIVLRYTQNIFPERYESTIEDQHSKHISAFQRDYNLRVTDTGGQHEYSVFPRSCSLDMNGFVLVYAIDDRKSFEMCGQIYEQIVKTYGDSTIPAVFVGNKIDLDNVKGRVVTYTEGKEMADKFHLKFLEITAKDSPNRVNEVFETLLREIEISRGNLYPAEARIAPVVASQPSEKDKKNCVIS